MASLNKIQIIGHLGKDPETRFIPSGGQVTTFSVAVSETFKDKIGEKQTRTEWFNCVAFNRIAEIASEYIAKGSLVYVEGSLRTEKWTDKEGNPKQATKINVRSLQMLDKLKKKEGGGEREPGEDGEEMPF